MKQQLQRLAQRINAMNLRERAITFITIVFLLLFLVDSYLIEPQFNKQKILSEQIQQDRVQIDALQTAIQQIAKRNALDPDGENLLRLQALKQEYRQVQGSLLETQKGLIPSDKMVGVLEDILKRNGRLHLISLKSLPTTSLNGESGNEANGPAGQAGAATASSGRSDADRAEDLIYRHGVEMTLQGNYLDMLQYMQALESLPWQLFWGKAALTVEEYPRATLTLTLFTLSLDKKWLNL